jgi:hypothetical protein
MPGDNMSYSRGNTEFVVKPVPFAGDPSEFRQLMVPHPLVHQELPHDPDFGIYKSRLRSLHYGNVRTDFATSIWRKYTSAASLS